MNITNIGARVDLIIRKGATWSFPVTMKQGGVAIDITGRTYGGVITRDDTGATVATFTCAITDGAKGVWLPSLTAAQTAAITEGVPLSYSWEETNGAVVTEIFYGSVTVVRNL